MNSREVGADDVAINVEGEGEPMAKGRKHHLHQNKKAQKWMRQMKAEEEKFKQVYCTRCRECRPTKVEAN